ncbi:MAG: PA14 domain-containing protein [Planctomycetia bacterium]|nr:PA14 domain-containing protein [Planctomycetia bacterium]
MTQNWTRLTCAMLCFCAFGSNQAFGSGAYSDAVISLNPTHFYQLDETAIGAPRLDGGGNKKGTASGVGGFQYDGPVIDTGTSGSPINGFYEGFFNGIDPAPFATIGAAGPQFPGFDANNRAFDANDRGSINLGPGSNFAANAMTVSYWFAAGNALAGDRFFANNQTDPSTAFQTVFGNSANFVVSINPNGNTPAESRQVDHATVNVKDRQWHHVVASRNGNNIEDVIVVIDGHDFSNDLVDSTDGWGTTGNDAHIASRDGGDGGPNQRTVTGAMDEVAVWLNRQLTVQEAISLYDAAVPPGAQLPDIVEGHQGLWGVRAYRPNFLLKNGLQGADQVLADESLRVERNATDSTSPTLNFANGGDDVSMPAPKTEFVGGRTSQFVLQAEGTIRIPEDGTYTFGFDGDNAVRLTVGSAVFTKQAGGDGVAANGGTFEQAAFTTDAFGLASTFLAAGDYPISVVYAEQYGGGFLEVFAAKGAKTALDNDFALIGQQAAVYAQGTTPSIVNGFQVAETVRVPEDVPETAINNLAQARNAVLNPNPTDQPYSGTRDTINFVDAEAAGSRGKYGDDGAFLNNFENVDDNDFAMLATATLHIETDGVYTFGFDTDNGASLTIDGASFTIQRSVDSNVAAVLDGGETVAFDSAAYASSYTLASTFLTAGDHELEFLMFERNGASSAELFAAVGEWNNFYSRAFTLLGEPARAVDIRSPAGLELIGDAVGTPGDTNGDGQVTIVDLNNVRNNFGGAGLGDTNGDGQVTIVDLNNVRNNFGAGTGANAVPEPSSLVIMLGCGLGLIGWMRRH